MLHSASSNYMNKICISTLLPDNMCFRKQSCLQAVGGASMGNAYMYLYIYIYIYAKQAVYIERDIERDVDTYYKHVFHGSHQCPPAQMCLFSGNSPQH